MNFINQLFKSNRENEASFPWKILNEETELELIEKASFDHPQLLFKHSKSCGISNMVLRGFERKWNGCQVKADFHFLDLLAFRSLSNQISQHWGVIHQSPQLIVLSHGKVITHESHGGILDLDWTQFTL